VLFRQQSPGLDGRPFTPYKFPTMRDESGATDQARLTRCGAFLRNTSLEELPELWNILRGQTSLVGPRPLLMQYLDRYSPEQRRRHEVLPGISGWAQINGRNATSWDDRFALDLWYVDHELLAYLKISLSYDFARSPARRDQSARTREYAGFHRIGGNQSDAAISRVRLPAERASPALPCERKAENAAMTAR